MSDPQGSKEFQFYPGHTSPSLISREQADAILDTGEFNERSPQEIRIEAAAKMSSEIPGARVQLTQNPEKLSQAVRVLEELEQELKRVA